MRFFISLSLVFLFLQSSISFAEDFSDNSDCKVVFLGGSKISSTNPSNQKEPVKTVFTSADRIIVDLYDDGSIVVKKRIFSNPQPYSYSVLDNLAPELLHDIVDITATYYECYALRKDGVLIMIGDYEHPDSSPKILFENVITVVGSVLAIAGIQEIQGVRSGFTYGRTFGGDSSKILDKISSNVLDVVANCFAFSFRVTDGSDTTVVSLGAPEYEGDSSSVADKLHDIVKVEPNDYFSGFIATRRDGSKVSWGEKSK